MSSIMTPQGAALVTAMAVSGTVILLALRLQKSPSITHFPLNSCIISSDEGKKREKRMKKKKKKVHFAEDVVDPIGNSDEYRKLHSSNILYSRNYSKKRGKINQDKMPANRQALYNGILRDRVLQKVTYSC